jgi:hypothetical protein
MPSCGALIIRKDEEWIVIEKILDDRAEQLAITAAEGAAGDEVDASRSAEFSS